MNYSRVLRVISVIFLYIYIHMFHIYFVCFYTLLFIRISIVHINMSYRLGFVILHVFVGDRVVEVYTLIMTTNVLTYFDIVNLPCSLVAIIHLNYIISSLCLIIMLLYFYTIVNMFYLCIFLFTLGY